MGDATYVVDTVKLCAFGKVSFILRKGLCEQEFIIEHDALKSFTHKNGYCDGEALRQLFELKREQFIYVAYQALGLSKQDVGSPIYISKAMILAHE